VKMLNTAVSCFALSTVLLLQPRLTNGQDVAAAARANLAAKARPMTPEGAWYSPTRVTLRALQQTNEAAMVYEISSNQDLRITMDMTRNGKHQTGEVMLINGQSQWLLAKNVPLEKGYEIDALDVPVLNLKLVLELLRAAAPGGPSQVKEKTTFNVQEEKHSIAVSTASANSGLEAPWSLQATIEPIGADHSSFELTTKHEETMHLSGTWQKDAAPVLFSDELSLDGWQIFSIGPLKSTDRDGTILDYGARASKKHAKTLGELRKMTADSVQ
jgi:hypothetical protein